MAAQRRAAAPSATGFVDNGIVGALARLIPYLGAVCRRRMGLVVRPRFLTYTVTFRCNARCVMCDSWQIPPVEEMTAEEAGRVFVDLPRMDAVRLTGGEPFLRSDLLEIAHLAQEHLRPLVLHITTNGLKTARILEFAAARRRDVPLQMLVSLDAVEEEHDRIRGVENAWSRAIETLREVAAHADEWRITPAVNQTVIDDRGLEHYCRLRELLSPMDIAHNVVFAYDASATYSVERDREMAPGDEGAFITFGDLSPKVLDELVAEIRAGLPALPLGHRLAKRYYLRGIENRLTRRLGRPNPPCVALGSHLRIFPNGDVPTCQFNSRIVGNLLETPLDQIWRSETTETQRRWVYACPGCWAECEVLPNAIYSGELAGELVR